ncbi:hypothetical protein CHS0354_023988 [Potamilus streckersoni]|uniref:RecA family profile 1 domain-containing protein n=1 Tax=Potamilus streckersoni TaxID=2493646 RepID=A0AAE0RZ76_9BIVA|nr:hypothetical protein CHS0354_023988 [Potamilus streckersoni]
MAKNKSRYVCSSCGSVSIKYQGKCFECGTWGSLIAESVTEVSQNSLTVTPTSVPIAKSLDEIELHEEKRWLTEISEFDRAIGGGIMPASVCLIGGEPGIGKSTLMLMIIPSFKENQVLYVSAEESLVQISSRARRMGITSKNLKLISETKLESILAVADQIKPLILIIDSIQTIFLAELESTPGSISQVRECASRLVRYAKENNVTTFIIGHITKEGSIAGPKSLEHIVDTVLQFEGESRYKYRILRALKNRFGSTNEIGVFEMNESGLAEVNNPSEIFLSERTLGISGSAIASPLEGSRPILTEVQALVAKTNYPVPQRVASGIDQKRLAILVAILEKRMGLPLWSSDIFLNIAGGFKITEPACDLAVAVAIVSSFKDIPLHALTVTIGEVGLAAELRAVPQIERRILEAEKLGFEQIIVPKNNYEKIVTKRPKIKVIPCKNLHEVLNAVG